MHPQKAMAVKSLPLSTDYFVLMCDVCKTSQIETNVLIGVLGCVAPISLTVRFRSLYWGLV